MREIKFREWQTFDDKGSMDYNPYVVDGDSLNDTTTRDDRVLMQYAGLKDKNGKEIYEGDIVRGDKGDIAEVKWTEDIDRDRFWATANGFGVYFSGNSNATDKSRKGWHTFEVIGNIYENPELLK